VKNHPFFIAFVLMYLALGTGSMALVYDFEAPAASSCDGLIDCVLTQDGVPLQIQAGLMTPSGEFTLGGEGATLAVDPDSDPDRGGLGVATATGPSQVQLDTVDPDQGEAVVFHFDPAFILEAVTVTTCGGGEGPRIFTDGSLLGDLECPDNGVTRFTIPLAGRISELSITPRPDLSDDNDFHIESIEGVVEIVIDGCFTGVIDRSYLGATITEWLEGCAETATNHGGFVSCVARLTAGLRTAGIISGREKGRIQSCAGRALIP
jgi:hypothetical protein